VFKFLKCRERERKKERKRKEKRKVYVNRVMNAKRAQKGKKDTKRQKWSVEYLHIVERGDYNFDGRGWRYGFGLVNRPPVEMSCLGLADSNSDSVHSVIYCNICIAGNTLKANRSSKREPPY
jgi:hypothetical protein